MHDPTIPHVLRRAALAIAALPPVLLAGCGSPATPAATAAAAAPSAAPQAITAAAPTARTDTAPAATGTLADRRGELTNPDDATMVYLYYDLAGIAPPIDQWVENDYSVNASRGSDRAARRATLKASMEAGMAAVRGVGVLHLTTRTRLSDYDPAYGEFTISALSPGSVFTFKALRQTVNLKLANGLAAQTWSVPKDKARIIADKVANDPLTLDVTLKIEQVLPGTDGGTLSARVVAWNLHDTRDGSTVARVQVPGS